jgi:hypothetical protein
MPTFGKKHAASIFRAEDRDKNLEEHHHPHRPENLNSNIDLIF